MVFSSVPPAYLDPPNWNQQQVHHGHLQPVTPPGLMASPTDVVVSGSVASGSSARPGSMSERARLAKIPQPEPGLKCPRCESSNTKFCYFNNYSLSQPRHFCKTCRRYWTRGGALRSVPVGGGCRRNKRAGKSSKPSSSTNTTASASASANGGTSSSTSSAATGGGAAAAVQPHLPFLASLHSTGSDHFSNGVPRLGFPGFSSLHPVDYHLAGAGGLALDHWRLPQMHQIPFLSQANAAAAPPMAGIYPFDTEGGTDAGGLAGQMLASAKAPSGGSAGLITQLASVKMEDNPPSAITGLGLSGSFQFWSCGNGDGGAGDGNGAGGSTASGSSNGGVALGGAWADMPAFNSLGNIL